MGNCLSMFSEDLILICDRLLQNNPFLNSGWKKRAIKVICRGTYAGFRSNYGQIPDEKKKSKITNRQMVEWVVLKWCVQYALQHVLG